MPRSSSPRSQRRRHVESHDWATWKNSISVPRRVGSGRIPFEFVSLNNTLLDTGIEIAGCVKSSLNFFLCSFSFVVLGFFSNYYLIPPRTDGYCFCLRLLSPLLSSLFPGCVNLLPPRMDECAGWMPPRTGPPCSWTSGRASLRWSRTQ
jgi:hypothetical protein